MWTHRRRLGRYLVTLSGGSRVDAPNAPVRACDERCRRPVRLAEAFRRGGPTHVSRTVKVHEDDMFANELRHESELFSYGRFKALIALPLE
jgi:hypothetical protein